MFLFLDRPHNPMLNSGAIMSAAILLNVFRPDMKSSDKFNFVTDYIKVWFMITYYIDWIPQVIA